MIVKRGGNIVSLFISEVYFLPCFVQSYFLLVVPGLWKALQMFDRDPWFLVVYSLISGIMLFELLFLIKCTLKLYAAKKEQEST